MLAGKNISDSNYQTSIHGTPAKIVKVCVTFQMQQVKWCHLSFYSSKIFYYPVIPGLVLFRIEFKQREALKALQNMEGLACNQELLF